MPDATGVELLAQELGEPVTGTEFFREKAALQVDPPQIADVLAALREKGFKHLMSVHGVDYWPEEPRFGVHYELQDRDELDRITVKLRVHGEAPDVPSVTELFPTANFQEREVFDMFGVTFAGHPDLRRILMPEDYEGFPQRRDFPTGGEPILFTHNEHKVPRYYE